MGFNTCWQVHPSKLDHPIHCRHPPQLNVFRSDRKLLSNCLVLVFSEVSRENRVTIQNSNVLFSVQFLRLIFKLSCCILTVILLCLCLYEFASNIHQIKRPSLPSLITLLKRYVTLTAEGAFVSEMHLIMWSLWPLFQSSGCAIQTSSSWVDWLYQ